MEAQIATYSLAVTLATGLLFGVSRMVSSLEERLQELNNALYEQHKVKDRLHSIEIIELFRRLMYLEKRQSGIEWMERLLGWGYISGYLFGISGFLVLLLCGTFNWSESTIEILTAIVSYLALASIVGNISVTIGIIQVCRRRMREARIAPIEQTDGTSSVPKF